MCYFQGQYCCPSATPLHSLHQGPADHTEASPHSYQLDNKYPRNQNDMEMQHHLGNERNLIVANKMLGCSCQVTGRRLKTSKNNYQWILDKETPQTMAQKLQSRKGMWTVHGYKAGSRNVDGDINRASAEWFLQQIQHAVTYWLHL